MARQQVEQVKCDRCKRVELQPSLPTPKSEPDFSCRFEGKDLVYADLCTHCRSSVARHLSELKQWERELNQDLLGPALQNNQAPPVSAAPDYSPPKPHSSAAAVKKVG